jgi:hypothetical protein
MNIDHTSGDWPIHRAAVWMSAAASPVMPAT